MIFNTPKLHEGQSSQEQITLLNQWADNTKLEQNSIIVCNQAPVFTSGSIDDQPLLTLSTGDFDDTRDLTLQVLESEFSTTASIVVKIDIPTIDGNIVRGIKTSGSWEYLDFKRVSATTFRIRAVTKDSSGVESAITGRRRVKINGDLIAELPSLTGGVYNGNTAKIAGFSRLPIGLDTTGTIDNYTQTYTLTEGDFFSTPYFQLELLDGNVMRAKADINLLEFGSSVIGTYTITKDIIFGHSYWATLPIRIKIVSANQFQLDCNIGGNRHIRIRDTNRNSMGTHKTLLFDGAIPNAGHDNVLSGNQRFTNFDSLQIGMKYDYAGQVRHISTIIPDVAFLNTEKHHFQMYSRPVAYFQRYSDTTFRTNVGSGTFQLYGIRYRYWGA